VRILAQLLRAMAASDTGRAAGLASAVIASNVIALVFTIVFARALDTGYGSLAALLSAFIILMVPGSALQIAVAREVSHAVAAGDQAAAAGVRRWLGRLIFATALAGGARNRGQARGLRDRGQHPGALRR